MKPDDVVSALQDNVLHSTQEMFGVLPVREVVCTCHITAEQAERYFGKCPHGQYPDVVTVATTYTPAGEDERHDVVHFSTGVRLALRKTEIVTVH